MKYDVALSFAGEDRKYVEEVATELKQLGVRVFYDDFEKVDLWGKHLYTHLQNVYQNEAEYTVIFISEYYAKKLWTNHERKMAQARAFTENREYILPARFDDTEIEGITKTTGYIDLQKLTPKEFSKLITQKIETLPNIPSNTSNKEINNLPKQAPNAFRFLLVSLFLIALLGVVVYMYHNSSPQSANPPPQNNVASNIQNLTQQINDAKTTINNNPVERNQHDNKDSVQKLTIPRKEFEKNSSDNKNPSENLKTIQKGNEITNSNTSDIKERALYKGGFSCPNPLPSACLNCMKLTFTNPAPACTDFTLIDASLNSNGYSKNAGEWEKGRIAHSGDEINAFIYINNGAADDAVLNPVAKDVAVETEIDTAPKFLHYINVKVTSDTTDSIEGKFKILTNENEKLEVIANSGEFFDTFGNKLLSGVNVGNNTLKIGDLNPHYQDALFIHFKLKVIKT